MTVASSADAVVGEEAAEASAGTPAVAATDASGGPVRVGGFVGLEGMNQRIDQDKPRATSATIVERFMG